MTEYNIYCDESNHLESDAISPMLLGAVYIPKEKLKAAIIRKEFSEDQ